MFNFLLKDKVKSVNINEIDDLIGKVNLVDIREQYEYKSGTLKGAKNIPMRELMNNPDKYLKQGNTYHLFCLSGARSQRASSYLHKQGYDVVNLLGGIGSYTGTKRN